MGMGHDWVGVWVGVGMKVCVSDFKLNLVVGGPKSGWEYRLAGCVK